MKISNKTGSKRHFSNVGALVPERSAFDLSYSKTFTCDMGELIPVMCDEVVPGDVFKIGCESVIRFQPLVAPCCMKSISMCIISLCLTVYCGVTGKILLLAELRVI